MEICKLLNQFNFHIFLDVSLVTHIKDLGEVVIEKKYQNLEAILIFTVVPKIINKIHFQFLIYFFISVPHYTGGFILPPFQNRFSIRLMISF